MSNSTDTKTKPEPTREHKQEGTAEGKTSATDEAAVDEEVGAQPAPAPPADDGEAPGADEEDLSDAERLRREVADHVSDDEAAHNALGELVRRAEQAGDAQEELATTKNQLARKAASLQNFRRRARLEQARSREHAQADVLRRFLDVLDDFDRSLEAADQGGNADAGVDYEAVHQSLKEGVEMVREKFRSVLSEMDVEPIEAVGEPFDEQLHEAMMRQPAPEEAEPGEVLHEVQKGYRMGEDRVLRHSRVIVAGPREVEENEA